MTTIDHELQARCAPEVLWDLLSDLTAVGTYNPGVSAVRIRGERSRDVGAMRECDLVPKGRVCERVTVWEPGRAVGLEIVESDWPINYMRWVTHIEPEGAGNSRLTQRLEYQVKFGLFGMMLDRLVMRRNISTAVGNVLAGLVAAAERKRGHLV